MRKDLFDKRDYILECISNNMSKASICKELKVKQQTFNSYLKKMGIEYKGNQPGKGIKSDPKRLDALILATKDYVSSSKLKTRLIEDGYKEHKCEICKLTEWNDEKIPLELHHIDNNHFNNDINNLQILCPNCHAQIQEHIRK